MYKELLNAAISGEEVNIKARSQVRRAGGLDAMTAKSVTVRPAAGREPEYNERPVEDVLSSSRDIIPDLKEEV